MLFNSYQFIFVFFPLVLVGFFLIGRRSPWLATGLLTLASLFFYGWWSVKAMPLLLASIALNYWVSLRISPSSGRTDKTRKAWLQAALVANLGTLGVFKYADFFVENLNVGLVAAHWQGVPALHLTLPIGISFYTFTQIAFLVDSWRGLVREKRFTHYALFVTYFPHLIAGPVLHHAQMMPQFASATTYRFAPDKVVLGLSIFTVGLCKKVLLADPMGGYADLIFGAVKEGLVPSTLTAWLGALAYAMQIYFDFSGYSDMAIGLSLCLGIQLPINFNSPYKAANIIEFWRRWHISLSTFLRDYLYIPLGGNRFGEMRRHVNLLTTMLLGGLWHGAAWTFVLWGAMHGGFLVVNHLWQKWRAPDATPTPAAQLAGWLLTFICVCLAWVMFRANSVSAAIEIYKGMFGLNHFSSRPFQDLTVPYKQSDFYKTLLLGLLICLALPSKASLGGWLPCPASWQSAKRLGTVATALTVACLFVLGVSRLGSHSPFLYFQF
jgi:alginate O-acetyltransferase complex protein AlgI